MGADGMVKNLDVKKDLLLSKSLIYAGYHSEGWWWTLPLGRTFLNNACGLVRKHAELCGLSTLRQLAMKPRGKALFALLQQNIRQPLERIGAGLC